MCKCWSIISTAHSRYDMQYPGLTYSPSLPASESWILTPTCSTTWRPVEMTAPPSSGTCACQISRCSPLNTTRTGVCLTRVAVCLTLALLCALYTSCCVSYTRAAVCLIHELLCALYTGCCMPHMRCCVPYTRTVVGLTCALLWSRYSEIT